MWLIREFLCSSAKVMLTTLVRTARKEPLVCSVGSSMKKLSVSSMAFGYSEDVKGEGLGLNETHTHIRSKTGKYSLKKHNQ